MVDSNILFGFHYECGEFSCQKVLSFLVPLLLIYFYFSAGVLS